MTSPKPPRPASKALLLGAIFIGSALVIIALLADQFGYGQPGSVGVGQILLVLFGMGIILVGFLGRRTLVVYQTIAIIMLNTVVLIMLLELASIALVRVGLVRTVRHQFLANYIEIAYYQGTDWASLYWDEALQAENYQYQPYVIWRHGPYRGETINISRDGIRITPGADCGPGSFRVYTFGGSSMWGWGSPDWETIPAHLQAILAAELDQPVCTINYGEDGYISTQSLMMLVLALRSYNPPDAVIFYDGVNDVYASYQSGRASVPVYIQDIEARFEQQEHPLVAWLKSSRQFSLYQYFYQFLLPDRFEGNGGDTTSASNVDSNQLVNEVTSAYLKTIEVVKALSEHYGFDYYFFWQPHLGLDPKGMTPAEEALLDSLDVDLKHFTEDVYSNISLSMHDDRHLWSLVDVFQGEDRQIWIDTWGHVTPEGNRLVAEAMAGVIELPTTSP